MSRTMTLVRTRAQATHEVASHSHHAQVPVREHTLQHSSDAVMNQCRQMRVPDVQRLGAGRETFVEEGAH